MLLTILASIGIGIVIFVILMRLDGIIACIKNQSDAIRSTVPNVLLTIAVISAYYIIIGVPELTAIGLTTAIFLSIYFIIGAILKKLVNWMYDYSLSFKERYSIYLVRTTINFAVISVFAVLIINHFGLI